MKQRRDNSFARRSLRAAGAILSEATVWLGHGIDHFAMAVSPRWGTRRKLSRALSKFSEEGVRRWRQRRYQVGSSRRSFNAFEGAERDRHRGSSWLASRLSPDSALEEHESLATMRERANELALNNCWMANYHNSLTCYVVGSGRRPQAKIIAAEGICTAAEAKRYNAELEDCWRRWSEQCGSNGECLGEIQQRLVYNRSKDGDAFLVLRDVGSADKPIPLTLEVIAADRVETPPSKIGDKRIRHGIERDDRGRVVAVWIRHSRPGDTLDTDETHTRVPVYDRSGRRRVLHFKRHTWEGASRGLPDCHAVINDLKDLDDLWEAQAVRQYVQACMAGFVSQPFDPEDAAAATAAETTADGQRIEDFSPGMIEYLRPGEEITFSQPAGEDNLDPFMSWRLRAIAAGLQFPFELLVRKWENSYSGGRLALIDGHQRFKAEAKLLDDQVNNHIWAQFVVEALLVGELSVPPAVFRAHPEHFSRVRWLGDALPWIDPENEVESEAKAVALGLDTKTNALARRGIDLEEYIETRRHEMALEKEAGLPELIPAGWAERLTPEQLAEAAAGTVAEPGDEGDPGESETGSEANAQEQGVAA